LHRPSGPSRCRAGKFENIIETDIGTTIGGYSGPGTIGIVFAKKV
jgi:fatty acid-binding protein DegV